MSATTRRSIAPHELADYGRELGIPALYHFTCSCCERQIGNRGTLRPHRQPMIGDVAAVWATDLPEVPENAAVLGLTSYTLSCDRTEHRYRVSINDRHLFEHFPDFQKRTGLGADLCGPDQQPEHWWIAFDYVRVIRAPRGSTSGADTNVTEQHGRQDSAPQSGDAPKAPVFPTPDPAQAGIRKP